jgi:methylated-DNA-[protein]-cysteine S-methyltransferase
MPESVDFRAPGGLVLRVVAGTAGICAIEFNPPPGERLRPGGAHPLLERAVEQLGEYFAGVRRRFTLPLEVRGTEFQRRVWGILESIPYGETRSYTWVAERVGRPRAVRAVGAANGRNPLPIVVPCHRVIGAAGQLVGYGGGLPLKKFLLDLEIGHAHEIFSALDLG